MQIREKSINIPSNSDGSIFELIRKSLKFHLGPDEIPIRFVIANSDSHSFRCEVSVIQDVSPEYHNFSSDLFTLRKRKIETADTFNAALLIPTGVGAEIGGHAGDATAVAKLLAESCNQIMLHPNVVNASDINEMPENALYVEGSILDRLLMGTVGLQPIRSNRVLVIIDDHPDKHFVDAAINSVSAARATYGLNCPEVVCLNPPIRMFTEYAESGRATGRVENLSHCLSVLAKARARYDAVALASVIRVPQEFHKEYFDSQGVMVNPWGGVEAMLTHAVSFLLDIPTAHSPMLESRKIENIEAGVVEPRMSAEAVSLSFLQCILKGLQRAPRIIRDESLYVRSDVFSVEDISCLIIPDGCLGLPIIAALEQGITVIAVKENNNLMKNDLSQLPWRGGQFIQVDSYLEASGIMNALRAGVTIESVRRPISYTTIRNVAENDNLVTSSKPA